MSKIKLSGLIDKISEMEEENF